MPLATYSAEYDLAVFMSDTVGPLAGILGWALATSPNGPGSFQRIVNAALRLYPLSAGQTIADATDAGRLEAAARVAVWDAAAQLAPTFYATTTGNQSLSRNQVYEQITAERKQAHSDALLYGIGGYEVGQSAIAYGADPYVYAAEDDL